MSGGTSDYTSSEDDKPSASPAGLGEDAPSGLGEEDARSGSPSGSALDVVLPGSRSPSGEEEPTPSPASSPAAGAEPGPDLNREEGAEALPDAKPPADGPWRGRLRLVGVFVLGGLAALALLAPRRYPVTTYATWCRLRYGGAPSAGGLVLTLSPCPRALRGRGPGPWVLAEFRDISGLGTTIWLGEQAGEELSFRGQDSAGRALAPRAGLDRVGQARAYRAHSLAPGGRLALPLDLSAWLELPADWERLSVTLARARVGAPPLGDGHLLVSRPLELKRSAR